MNRLLAAMLAALSLLGFAAPAGAQTSDDTKRPSIITGESGSTINSLVIDPDLAQQAQTFAAIRRIPASENAAVSSWLSTNHRELLPVFLFELTRRLWEMDQREEATDWYAIALLRSLYDAGRCADPTAIGGLLFGAQLAPDVVGVEFTHPSVFAAAKAKAMARDDVFSDAISPWWICSHGVRTGMAGNAERTLQKEEWLKPESEWAAVRTKVLVEFSKMGSATP